MKNKIAEFLTKEMESKNITKQDLVVKGINQNVYQSILQIGKFKGKSYTIKSLSLFLKAIEVDKIELDIDGNKCEIRF